MSRVATIPLQRTMSQAIAQSQEKLAVTQARLSTGKKASDFASLGTETVRNLSAHTLLARQDAQATVAKRVGTTLSLYDSNLSGMETAVSDLRTSILDAIGTGKASGLQEAMEGAFATYRNALNASEGGVPLFGGGQIGSPPFKTQTLADAATTTGDAAFTDDKIRVSARVADGIDVKYGIGASDVGKGLFEAFKTLAAAGQVGDVPTDAQKDALTRAVGQMDDGLAALRSVNAENGRRRSQVETLATRGEQRSLLLKDIIEGNEDADLGQVALDLAQQKTMLQASYSVFSQLSGLSLVSYIR